MHWTIFPSLTRLFWRVSLLCWPRQPDGSKFKFKIPHTIQFVLPWITTICLQFWRWFHLSVNNIYKGGEVSGGHSFCQLCLPSSAVWQQPHKTNIQQSARCGRRNKVQIAFQQSTTFVKQKKWNLKGQWTKKWVGKLTGGWQPAQFFTSSIFCSPETVPSTKVSSIQVQFPPSRFSLSSYSERPWGYTGVRETMACMHLYRWVYVTLTTRAPRTPSVFWSAAKMAMKMNIQSAVLLRVQDRKSGRFFILFFLNMWRL